MAEAVDTGLLPRTYFKAPRVPFDFRALALAVAGYLVWWGGGRLVNEIFGSEAAPRVVESFLGAIFELFRGLPYIGREIGRLLGEVFHVQVETGVAGTYGFWRILVGGIWFFAVWSFFGQAIHRITALRIARDEGLTFGEALTFAWKNWPTMLLAPAILAALMGFFYGCNALAGLVVGIPFVGQILALILVPLAVISTLLLLLIAIGGVFGLPLVGAAAAWERNGSLDAISRAFSYLFARPLQFFWAYFLIFLFVGIILLVGGWFLFTLTKSIDAGNPWDDQLTVLIDNPSGRVRGPGSEFAALSQDAQNLHDRLAGKTQAHPPALDAVAIAEAPWGQKLNALIFWIVLNLIWLGVGGYAVYWFLGASTCVYADLRADVDGTEEDEIYLEEDEEEFEDLLEEPETPAAPAGDGGEGGEPAAGEGEEPGTAPEEGAEESPSA